MTTPYLPPIDRPRGMIMKLAYWAARRMFGKVPTPLAVASARMPFAFFRFSYKISQLDRKLELPHELVLILRQQVSGLNGCEFCMDLQRWYVGRKTPGFLERFDALGDYWASPLYSDADRAALDFVTELTTRKHVTSDTFAALSTHFSEREICELAWVTATEHVYNISNHGLNIGSDGLCRIQPATKPRREMATVAAVDEPAAASHR